jgi:hypothetical protein
MYPTVDTTSSKQRLSTNTSDTRRAARHCLKHGFIAFNSDNFGEIINISQTGMAIEFMAQKNTETKAIPEISLINNLDGYLLSQLGCSTVYISDIPLSPTDSFTVLRRIGLEFTSINEKQESQLNSLITNYSNGKYSTMSQLQ